MINLNDCPHCGLPTPLCVCKTPDAVYNAADIARTELITNREISPAEGLSDYGKTRMFTDSYLYGHKGHLTVYLRGKN